MKKELIGFCALAMLFLSMSWLSEGCKGSLPAIPAVVPTPQPSYVISNFSNGSLNMNPSLLNGDGGYFFPETYGGAAGHANLIDGSQNPDILVPNPGDGSSYAVHVFGPQSDPAPTTYPAMEVFAFMKNNPSNPYYDLTQTSYTGIRFDFKMLKNPNPAANNPSAWAVTVGDNNPQKRFALACAPMVPPTTDVGGTCPPPFSTNCYNYFWIPPTYASDPNGYGNLPYTNPAVNNGWMPVSFTFASLISDNYYGFDQKQTLANYPNDAKQVLFLLWKFGDNGESTTVPGAPTWYTYTDFWFDNVQFY